MPRAWRFEEYELDLKRCELRRAGRALKLEKIPFELLVLLIEKNGDLATREEIAKRLWGNAVARDIEQGINTAVRKIRLVLKDDPDRPRFVQTVVGRGYRFIAPVSAEPEAIPETLALSSPEPRWSARHLLTGGIALGVLLALLGYWMFSRIHTPAARKMTIAVLPFVNLSGDPNQDYFSDGLTEDMITQLGRLDPAELGVIARTSVMRYRDHSKPVNQIGLELGVDYVLEGSVRKEGARIRITAQLIRTRDQTHLWAKNYDRDLTSALAVESEVAAAVADEIRLQLTTEDRARLAATRAVDPEAYDAYLKGRQHWNLRTEADLHKAIEHFQHAIDRDPAYGAAWAGKADSYAALGYGNYLAPSDAFSRARAAIARARQLDPRAPEANASEGYLAMYFDWDFEGGERHLRRALEINSNYATARQWLGVLLTAKRRFDDAAAELGRAARLDPLSAPIRTDIGFAMHYSGRNEDAVRALQDVLVLNTRFALARFWLGRVYAERGACELALAELAAGEPALRDWQPMIAARGYISGRCGDADAARAMLEKFDQLSRTRYVTSYGRALVHSGLSNKDEALRWLNRAYDERSHWMVWLHLDPRFASLRPDIRFQALLSRVGLSQR